MAIAYKIGSSLKQQTNCIIIFLVIQVQIYLLNNSFGLSIPKLLNKHLYYFLLVNRIY